MEVVKIKKIILSPNIYIKKFDEQLKKKKKYEPVPCTLLIERKNYFEIEYSLWVDIRDKNIILIDPKTELPQK